MQSPTVIPHHPQSSQLSTIGSKNGTALQQATQNKKQSHSPNYILMMQFVLHSKHIYCKCKNHSANILCWEICACSDSQENHRYTLWTECNMFNSLTWQYIN